MGFFVGKIGVASPTRVKGIRVRVIWWPIVEVIEVLGFFDGEVLE